MVIYWEMIWPLKFRISVCFIQNSFTPSYPSVFGSCMFADPAPCTVFIELLNKKFLDYAYFCRA